MHVGDSSLGASVGATEAFKGSARSSTGCPQAGAPFVHRVDCRRFKSVEARNWITRRTPQTASRRSVRPERAAWEPPGRWFDSLGPRPAHGKVLEPSASRRGTQTWAMLIKRVYEIDPLACPECGGQMKVVAFIEPPQGDVIEKILRHCGLWCPSSPRAPPAEDGRVHDPDGDADRQTAASDEPRHGRSWTSTRSGRPSDFPRRSSGRGRYAPAASSGLDLHPIGRNVLFRSSHEVSRLSKSGPGVRREWAAMAAHSRLTPLFH